MAFVIVRLHSVPIVLAPAIGKRCLFCNKLAALDGFHPRRMAKSESLLTLHETVPLIVIALYGSPIMHPVHKGIISNIGSIVCRQNIAGLLPSWRSRSAR